MVLGDNATGGNGKNIYILCTRIKELESCGEKKKMRSCFNACFFFSLLVELAERER